ncbi:MAG: TonB-dependent receptor, partial [Caulobacterales bacterium]|nr:TonB-dependent receptor [Caulobacterales bacterium]
NEAPGRLNEQESLSASGFLYFDPTPDISGSVRLIHQDIDDGHFAIDLQDSSFNNVFPESRGYFEGVVPVRDDSEFGLNTDEILNPGVERETRQLLATLDYDIGGSGYVASYIGGLTAQEETSGIDQTYDETAALFLPPFFPGGPSVCTLFITNGNCGVTAFHDTGSSRRDVLSHEVRLTTPSDARVRASVGFFHLNERVKPLLEYLEITEFGPDTPGDRDQVKTNAFFGSVEVDVTDRFTAGFELRYSEDDITTTGQAYLVSDFFTAEDLEGLSNPDPNQVRGDTEVREASFSSTLPRVTLRYALTDNINVYGQYSEGNSPGGFNSLDAPVTTIDEEKLTNYEIGLKGVLPSLRGNFSLAGFFIDYENQGLTQTFVTEQGGLDSFVANLGTTEIKGLEFEGSSRITDALTLSGSFAYLDAEITEGTNNDQGILLGGIDCLDEPGGVFNPTPECLELASIVGKDAPLVSKYQATASARYEAPTGYGDWNWFAGGDLIYRSSFFAQVHNLAETGDATRINLQAGFQNDRVRVTAWGENVADNDTPNGILRYVDFQVPEIAESGLTQRAFAITPAAKPTYGVTASIEF